MGPLFLTENLFNVRQFPSHLLSAQTQADNHEVWRVANSRRTLRDYWSPTATSGWVKVVCNRPRTADTLFIDRNSNLAGRTVTLTVGDGPGTALTVFTATVPSQTYARSSITSPNGVRTEEGAWIKKFDYAIGTQWRITVSGGTGNPQVGGVWLGKAFTPTNKPALPWSDEPRELLFTETLSPAAWSASSRKAQRKRPSVSFRVQDDTEYAKARYHLGDLLYRGFVSVYVPDTDYAERAIVAAAPSGVLDMPYSNEWPGRVASVELVEHQPRPQ
jgi:hypothetical protein